MLPDKYKGIANGVEKATKIGEAATKLEELDQDLEDVEEQQEEINALKTQMADVLARLTALENA